MIAPPSTHDLRTHTPGSTSATLLSYGWRTWPQALPLLGQAGATWLGTARVEQVPAIADVESMPLTTRIHAWTTAGLLWRLLPKPAAQLVLVTGLARPHVQMPAASPAAALDVAVAEEHDRTWTRVRVQSATPVTFMCPAPGVSRAEGQHDG